MAELIPRDWVMKNLLFDVDRDVVRAAPAVDRVKIVRCRECDHCTHSVFDPYGRGFCEKIERAVEDDFFCGFAMMDGGTERKSTGKQCSKIVGEHCGRLQELAEALCGDLLRSDRAGAEKDDGGMTT